MSNEGLCGQIVTINICLRAQTLADLQRTHTHTHTTGDINCGDFMISAQKYTLFKLSLTSGIYCTGSIVVSYTHLKFQCLPAYNRRQKGLTYWLYSFSSFLRTYLNKNKNAVWLHEVQ